METKKIIRTHSPGNSATRGHDNKVCSIRMLDDSYSFVSGGWDRNLIFWDTRKLTCTHQVLAVKVGGEAIDTRPGSIFIG